VRGLFFWSTFFVCISLACASLPAIPAARASATPAGAILFQDDFSQPVTGWDRLQADEGVMDYDAGGYRILVKATRTNFWATPHRSFADVRMEVDAGKLGGPDENRIGLICRYTGSDYYFFMVTSDGYYGIGIFAHGAASLLGQAQMRYNDRILKGMTINHLRADCAGDLLTLYINGFETASVRDATLKSGDVGLMAGTFGEPGADIIFDNFVVLGP